MLSLQVPVGISSNAHLVSDHERVGSPAAARQNRRRIGLDFPFDQVTGIVFGFDLDIDVRIRPAKTAHCPTKSDDRFSIENRRAMMRGSCRHDDDRHPEHGGGHL